MQLENFDYNLHSELIAQIPVSPRHKSKLMIVERKSGKIEHRIFKDIFTYLNNNDVLVVNNTKVIPARLYGVKELSGLPIGEAGGGVVEILLLRKLQNSQIWEILLKPGRRVKIGTRIIFNKGELTGEILNKTVEGKSIIKFSSKGSFKKIVDKIGKIPLPPYIKRSVIEADKKRYQTIFAKKEGAVAAPTAGLHFSPQILNLIKNKGIKIIPVTLYIGWGTFAPVREEDISKHKMESEFYEVTEESAQEINQAVDKGKNIIAVGTTVVRTLESAAYRDINKWKIKAGSNSTDLFIYPGYEFKVVKKLVTNFHLPKSTLLMLVSAFAGMELVRKAYKVAIEEKYRFFSYGDAMLIK